MLELPNQMGHDINMTMLPAVPSQRSTTLRMTLLVASRDLNQLTI